MRQIELDDTELQVLVDLLSARKTMFTKPELTEAAYRAEVKFREALWWEVTASINEFEKQGFKTAAEILRESLKRLDPYKDRP